MYHQQLLASCRLSGQKNTQVLLNNEMKRMGQARLAVVNAGALIARWKRSAARAGGGMDLTLIYTFRQDVLAAAHSRRPHSDDDDDDAPCVLILDWLRHPYYIQSLSPPTSSTSHLGPPLVSNNLLSNFLSLLKS